MGIASAAWCLYMIMLSMHDMMAMFAVIYGGMILLLYYVYTEDEQRCSQIIIHVYKSIMH